MDDIFTQAKTIYELIDISIKISFTSAVLATFIATMIIYYLSKTWPGNPIMQIIILIITPIIVFSSLSVTLTRPFLHPECPELASEITIGCIDANDLASIKEDENYQDQMSQIIIIKVENLIVAPVLINAIPKKYLYALLFFALLFPFIVLKGSRLNIKP